MQKKYLWDKTRMVDTNKMNLMTKKLINLTSQSEDGAKTGKTTGCF